MRIKRVKRFEAAHRLDRLPADHKCNRLHGHSYEVIMEFEGDVDPHSGFVIDFGAIDAAYDQLCHDQLDHRHLNHVDGLDVPSVENVAVWIYDRINLILPQIVAVEVWETVRGAARYEP